VQVNLAHRGLPMRLQEATLGGRLIRLRRDRSLDDARDARTRRNDLLQYVI
jgi:hypothetical protein